MHLGLTDSREFKAEEVTRETGRETRKNTFFHCKEAIYE